MPSRPSASDGRDGAMKLLAGLKVLELARVLAGPWIGQLLADLGADVAKVERAGVGDDTRDGAPRSSRAPTARTCPPPIFTPPTAASVRSKRRSRPRRG